jgi:hypothetical protein
MADQYWSNVVLYLRMNGANGGTTFTNEVDGGTLVRDSSVTTSTEQIKFGSASGKFTNNNAGYPLKLPNTAAFLLDGDFTIEFWIYAITGLGGISLIGSDSSVRNHQLQLDCGSGGANRFGLYHESIGWKAATAGQVVGTNAWHAVAVCKSGTTLRFFYDGAKIGADVTGVDQSYDFRNGAIAALGGYTVGGSFTGYLDEFRITKGVARYSASYTPQTAEFDNFGAAAFQAAWAVNANGMQR